MLKAIRHHWPEYLMESAELGIFMISAGLFTTLLEYPASPVHQSIPSEFARRTLSGLAMGLTAVGLIYSPWGQQSGAHFNPAVTLSFLWLGKVKPWDALFYVISQTIGGLAGVLLVSFTLRDLFRQPPISYDATAPGAAGPLPAFGAETAISFALMSTVLFITNWQRQARYTGLFAGALVFLFITFEAPISGMSMNPARSLSSALPGGLWEGIWIYLTAPFLGMLVAVALWKLVSPRQTTACAKLKPREALLLGIDHTAISVSDTGRDVRFYRNLLGFRIVGESLNFGPEQEGLTHVFGSRLLITSLRAPAGPGIEFLEYLTPRRGRSFPANTQQNDLWSWSTTLIVKDLPAAVAELRRQNSTFISAGPEDVGPLGESGAKGVLIRDPEGHALLLRSE